jgi:hypothetical protein
MNAGLQLWMPAFAGMTTRFSCIQSSREGAGCGIAGAESRANDNVGVMPVSHFAGAFTESAACFLADCLPTELVRIFPIPQ